MQDHSLFVEKYRPQSVDSYVGNQEFKDIVSLYIAENDIQNLLLYGPAGTGKTSAAKLIVNKIECDYIYINASDERGIDTIREKVVGFASTMSFKPLKVVILDEADYLTIQSQAALRNVMEQYSRNTRFILTCNYVEKIIDPIQSRCQVVNIIPPSKKDIALHLVSILDEEKIEYEKESLKDVVNTYYPDLRKMLNTIQMFSKKGKLDLTKSTVVSSAYHKQIIDNLKSKRNWRELRQIIADSGVKDFEELFKKLYDQSSEYAPGKEHEIVILINEYSYKANFRIDKEINVMALLSEIINILNQKQVL
jgi:DNA polymerase III delta prime subunit|tara:strand:- start:23221 stop:24144 length:924 start_codon:yes stop_codon:yes gene_type:complete